MPLAGGTPNNLLYIDGEPSQKLKKESLVDDLERLIRAKAEAKAEREKDLIAKQ